MQLQALTDAQQLRTVRTRIMHLPHQHQWLGSYKATYHHTHLLAPVVGASEPFVFLFCMQPLGV